MCSCLRNEQLMMGNIKNSSPPRSFLEFLTDGCDAAASSPSLFFLMA